MAINFSGDFTTPRPLDEVYEFLSDPNKFGPLLPDFQSMTVEDATHFTVKVRVGVGNIRGNAEIKMELAEAMRPHRAQYKGQGTAVGSQITLTAGFDLSAAPDGTRVAWQGEANIFGKLASMAGGMLEPLGRKNIQKLIDGLQKALAESAPLTAGEVATQMQGLDTPVPEALQPEASAPQEEEVSPVEGPGISLMSVGMPQSGISTVEAPDSNP
ncbi:MAG: SRPBCC domain-containing protein, partial [Candidatus Korobacteraceae bacterium]